MLPGGLEQIVAAAVLRTAGVRAGVPHQHHPLLKCPDGAPERILDHLVHPAVAGKMFPRAGGGELTAREREVLVMVAYGHTNKEIAAVPGVTVKTVETHKANGMEKLGIGSRTDLVQYALSQGWLERAT